MTSSDTAQTNRLEERVRTLCANGYEAYDQGEYDAALRRFYHVWTELPKPQTEWQAAGWVLTAIGDAYYRKGDYPHAIEALRSALHCPKAEGNPFIHLRLAQCLIATDEVIEVATHIQQTLDNGGGELLDKELKHYADYLPG